jgi:hypothetical protein
MHIENRQRIVLTRLVTGSLLFFLLLRFLEQTTLSGLLSPPLFKTDLDITYWLYKWSGLPALIVHNRVGAIIFDGLLFATGLLSFVFPLRRKWIIPFSLLLILYVLSFNMFATHHAGQVCGFVVVLLPFWIADNTKFGLAWEGMRYFTCFVYVIAFVWKTCIGDSFYSMKHGVNSFRGNLVDYMWLNPDSFMTQLYKYCLRHEWVLNYGEKAVVLLEGVMVIGFFTRKFDKTLIWIPVVIHIATYFFSDVFFIELLVIDLSFMSLSQLDRVGNWFAIKSERREK